MTAILPERLFSMSAFEGLRQVRVHRSQRPLLDRASLVDLIRQVDPDGGTYDYEAAFELDVVVNSDGSTTDAALFYQTCIADAIPAFRPVWNRVLALGRKKFAQKLTRDEEQCFRVAGLLDDPPTPPIVEWWDRTAGSARLAADQARLLRARGAERLSFELECNRTRYLGIEEVPQWIGFEDNTVGYDIRSFDLLSGSVVARLIEVKSTIMSPLRFRLSRNEWEAAVKFGASYHFHVWDLSSSPPRLHERTVGDVQPHIPTDNGGGRWENVEIPVRT